jgi:site-specific DNA-methyltransferase (adenine-specific)
MAVKVEDAGFEIRDQIMLVYGSGFPKSHNIGKAVDKINGTQREVIGKNPNHRKSSALYELGFQGGMGNGHITKGFNEWEGFGTALKPAHEPIVMARKPFKGSVAKNVLKWTTGGINIDDCRIEFEETKNPATNPLYRQENDYKMPKKGEESNGVVSFTSSKNKISSLGRFPANIIFDEEAGILLDEQSGECGNGWKKNYGEKDYKGKQYNSSTNQCIHGGGYSGKNTYSDKGGASRFFYCPKPSKKERNEGMPIEIGEFSQRPRRENGTVIYKETHLEEWTQVMSKLKRKDKTSKAAAEEKLQENSNGLKNNHPTIKPIKLMQYLIRLVTPIGGITIDPYFGSGSSGKSTIRENNDYKFIGIEKEKEYFNIAVERCQYEYSKSLKQAA